MIDKKFIINRLFRQIEEEIYTETDEKYFEFCVNENRFRSVRMEASK